MVGADLQSLGLQGLIDLVLELGEKLEAADRVIAELRKENAALKAQLGVPPKTPKNSSIPPSQERKANKPDDPKKKRKGHPGAFRALSDSPDRVIEAKAEACPHCHHHLSGADQEPVHAYDHIELPPIRPVTTRIHLHRGVCPCCRKRFVAPAPNGMAPGSPFGPNIAALVLYLHVVHAISFKRMVEMLSGLFGLTISQGAIASILASAREPMHAAAEDIAAQVRASKVIASDETSARVKGRTWWQWVWQSSTAVYHVITDSRGAKVPADFLQGAKPEVWVADRYAAQNGHAKQRQVCLAHLLRDTQYVIDQGDEGFAPPFKELLKRAIDIGRRRETLKDTTLRQYFYELDRELNRLLNLPPTSEAGDKFADAINRCYSDLFVFIRRRDVPPTNNVSERALRPSVIFRKVTGCFRSEWGANLYAAIVSVIATAQLAGKTALQAIAEIINPPKNTSKCHPTG
jgi:transposase